MTLRPRPAQIQALTDLDVAFAGHARAQLHMACGTGKTLVGRWHAETSGARRTLVLVPSLALVAQTLTEWQRASRAWPFDALIVCSDPTTAAGAAERNADTDDPDDVDLTATRAKVTTNHRDVMAFLRGDTGRPRVVFSTYHSAPVVVHAQAGTRIEFDLAICDEAHRLTGRPQPSFRVALDSRQILARRRLFMTATPDAGTRTYDEDDDGRFTMNDTVTFGPVAHAISFADAITSGALTDYQVLVIAEHAGDAAALPAAALRRAGDQHRLTRVLSFHGRVAKAIAFAELVDGTNLPDGRAVAARTVHGRQPAATRAETLRWLADAPPSELRLVASARCLNEGIDVPAIDGLLFADSRDSPVDIVQAVGRVLRPAPGKTIGTVILPVAITDTGDDDTSLAISEFGPVWAVLRALRSHDERLADRLDTARREHARTGRPPAGGTGITFLLPDGANLPDLELRCVEATGAGWERRYGLMLAWAYENNGARAPWGLTYRGARIGGWAEDQRIAHRRGLLPARRVRLLEEVPGWAWDRNDAWWNDSADLVEAAIAAYGYCYADGRSAFDDLRSADKRHRLGVWLARQRQLYRDGLLDTDRAARLERIPGFTWTPVPADDLAMIDALRVFVEFEKHADVPETHTEDGAPLGRWVYAVRRRKLTGRLHPALADEIDAAAGWRGRGAGGAYLWKWNTAETRWRLAYSALRQYAAREGNTTPRPGHRERLPDATIGLYQWISLQRHSRRRGELDDAHAAWLEAVPGWVWDAPGVALDPQEPIDVDGAPHGTAKTAAAGCKCGPCLEYRRDNSRRYLAQRRTLTDPVPAARATRHLVALRTEIATRIAGDKRFERPPAAVAYATAANVPIAVIRNVTAGSSDVAEREYVQRILAVTADDVLALYDTIGSRGRLTMSCEHLVDNAPTRRLIDDLVARGWNLRWIARELGYTQLAVKITGDTVTRRVADQVARLHSRVGQRRAPWTSANPMLPRLAEILAAEQPAGRTAAAG